MTSSVIGLALINITVFAPGIFVKIASASYILAIVVETYPLCYYANCLLYDIQKLPDTIFHSNWIGHDIRYQKMIIFFMQNTQRPIEFTAGKLFPISLSSCLVVSINYKFMYCWSLSLKFRTSNIT